MHRLITALILGAHMGGQTPSTAGSTTVEVALELPAMVALHEPAMARVTVRNTGQDSVTLDLGVNHKLAWELYVRPPNAPRAVRASYNPPMDEIGKIGRISVEPGGVFEKDLPLDQWFAFDRIGTYEISVALVGLNPLRNTIAVSEPQRLRVTPRNEATLKATCNHLATLTVNADLEVSAEAARKLSRITDVACLQAFTFVLESSHNYDGEMIGALSRTRTPETVVLLQRLSREEGARGDLARHALKRLQQR